MKECPWITVADCFISAATRECLGLDLASHGVKMVTTLYTNATILTVDSKRRILRDGAILVDGSRIVAIDKTSSLNTSTHPAACQVDLGQKIVIPGLVNGHIHLIQSLMRGLAEDMDLHHWASCAIWPLEVVYEGDDGYIAAKLAMAEMVKSGTTCFLEPMLPASAGFERIAHAVDEVGIRACLVRTYAPFSFQRGH